MSSALLWSEATKRHKGILSIISEKIMPLGDQPVRRRLTTGAVVSVRMRLNTFVRPGSLFERESP